jgi:hypothetical protein
MLNVKVERQKHKANTKAAIDHQRECEAGK